jgi:aminoglycoside phosphotransferase (APT) family kinase protein
LAGALPDGNSLLHGDFHPGNVLLSSRGPVVIDWPNATAGDATADFARTDLLLRMGDPPPGTPALVRYLQGFGRKLIRSAYRRAYLKARPTDEALCARWQLVRTADRLYADNIEVEHDTLRALLRVGGIQT